MITVILEDFLYDTGLHKTNFVSINHLYEWLSGYGCGYKIITYYKFNPSN